MSEEKIEEIRKRSKKEKEEKRSVFVTVERVRGWKSKKEGRILD